MADDGFLVDRFLASSPNASVLAASSLRRMTSASNSVRRTTTFSDFLSDSDDDEEFDGGVERMQQQADDMTYFQDAAFEGGSPPDDDDHGLLGASPPEDQALEAPPTAPRTTESSRATTTMSRATMSLRATTSRRTVGRLTNVRAPAVLRRLTSLKRRRKDKKAAAANARGTLSDVGGVILDSDESASDRGSQTDGLHDSDEERPPRKSKLSKYSEHDSSFASSYKGNGDSFAGAAPAIARGQDDGNDDSFYQRDRDNDDSFYRPNNDDDSFYKPSNDDSFHQQNDKPHNNDESFYERPNDDDSFYQPNSNDDSFHERPKNDDSFHGRNDSGKPHSNDDSFYERPKNDDTFYRPSDDDSFHRRPNNAEPHNNDDSFYERPNNDESFYERPKNDDTFYRPSDDDSFHQRPNNAEPSNSNDSFYQGNDNDESFYQRNNDDDSFYAPHDRSFKEEKNNDDSFYGRGDDTSFVGRHAEKHDDDDSFYRQAEDDTSFYGARPAVAAADDDDDGMDLHDHSADEEDEEEADLSFVGAPPAQQQQHHGDDDDNDDDDEFMYDDDGYDAEEEEQRRRDKEAAVREHEAEVRESAVLRASHRFSYRVSEEPFGQVARASHRFSYRMTEEPFGQVARASGAIGFEELEALGETEAVDAAVNPYASSASVDSVSSSVNGGGFFVESVRGSSESIAPLMDLASPAPSLGAMSTSSGSGGNSLSASALMRSGDLSFRTSFMAVSQQSFPATSPAPFSRSRVQPGSPVVASTRLTASTHRESSSSSSSGDSLVDENDASFSSNADDSFTGRARASSGDDSNLSFLFKNHVTSGCNDPDVAADAVAAVDKAVAVAATLKTQDKESEPPISVAVKETPSVVWPPKKETPSEVAPPKRSVAAWPPIKKEETVPIVAAVAAVAKMEEKPSVPTTTSSPVAKVSPPVVAAAAAVGAAATAAAPAVIPVKTLAAPAVPQISAVRSSVAADSDTRKTTKFAKPKPPARKRGPPQGKQNAGAAAAVAAAVASAAAAATVSIVHGAATATASAAASTAASVAATTTASSTASATASVAATPVKAAAPDASMTLSPRPSDNRLDFTGVFLGEAVEESAPVTVSSPARKPSQAENVPANAPRTVVAPELARASIVSSKPETEAESTFTATDSEAPAVRRVVNAQEASERKVVEFFRSTYIQNDDDDDLADLLGSARTRTRAHTAASRAMANERDAVAAAPPPMPTSTTRARRSSTSAMKTVDLKHITGQRLDDLLRANEEESKDNGFDNDDDEETYSDVAASEAPARKRTLSRPFPVNEDLLEKFPSRASTASSVAMASRRPPPHTPLSAYSVSSSGSSLPDSERPFSSHVIQRNFTLSLASGTIGKSEYSISPRTERNSPNAIPLPPDYMLSPRRERDRPSSSLGSFDDDEDEEEKSFGRNGPAQLPSLTVQAKALAGGSAAKSPNASSSYSSSVSSSSGIHAVAPGFRWHPDASQTPQTPGYKASQESQESSDDGSLGIKESIWHAAGAQLSMTNRPSAAPNVFQRASASVRTSLRRVKSQFLPFRRHYSADVPTSPQSIVAAPPQLPRGFDDREFYPRLGNIPCGDAILVVHKSSRGHATKQQAAARRRRTQAWLLLLGILFGLVLGIGLSFVDALAPTFTVRVNEITGERSVPNATKWLLLPGSLFLRIWNCVAMPLLFCQVVNGMAELAMTQKTPSVLSLRTLLYLVGVALLATLEGVGMAFVYHALGLFRSSQRPLQTAAASVKAAVRVADRVQGMGALLCATGETYLQAPLNGTGWQCSNETIPLPVERGINVTGRGQWLGSSAAVFAFTELPNPASVLLPKVSSHAASSSSSGFSSYYPTATASVGDMLRDFVASVSPGNFGAAFSISSASGIVAVAVAVGLVVGLRAFHRAITAQHFLQTSQSHRHRNKATLLAETILAKPHPVLGVLVELQQLLEWLAERLQCLTPFGVASLLAGHMVLHRDEWATVPGPVLSLIIGVALASLVHMLLFSPLLVLLVTRVNAWRSLASFLPAMALSFATGNVALSVPVAAQNFEAAQVVTKSMSQVGMGLAVALQRTGNALYYPLLMLFLLETTTPDGAVPMTVAFVFLLTGLTFLSCFLAVSPGPQLGLPGTTASHHLQVVLALFKVWTAQQLSGSATLPLVVVADVVLGHVAAFVSTHDHVVLTRLMAEHCAELCIRPGDAGAYQAGASPVYL